MSGYVYVIESSSGLFKVGYSANPGRRLATLATSTADKLALRAAIPGTMADEQDLHHAMEPWRVGREWFSDCLPIRALMSKGVSAFERPASSSEPPVRISIDQLLTSLIARIDAYLAASGSSESAIGRDAVNDDRFVTRLRATGNCTFKTYQKIDEWLWARECGHVQPSPNGLEARS